MEIEKATALVTGANRGLGRALATELIERGATVWAAAPRNPDSVDISGATGVLHLTGLPHARSGSRALSTYKQAVLVLRLLPHVQPRWRLG